MIQGLKDIKLQDLKLDAEYEKIISDAHIKSLEEILKTIEIYKMLNRKELVERLNALLPKDINVSRIKNIKLPNDAKILAECKKYDVFIIPNGTKEVFVVMSMFNDANINALELFLNEYDVITYKYVTPVNFMQLAGAIKIEYDYNILFKRIVLEALHLHATDIHFSVKHSTTKPEYGLEFRVDNRLVCDDFMKLNRDMNKKILFKVVHNKTNINPNDIDMTGVSAAVNDPLGDGRVIIRLSANRCIDGYMYVCRIQTPDTTSLKINELGFDLYTQQCLDRLSHKKSGCTLITGPIRSGKNTTAFAMANNMIKYPIKIVDYSSPIETLMPFSQVDYGGNPENLVNCIRLAKKQDLNIAFINEIPDKSVAFAVRDLVNSSVHVITTMHVDRLWHLPHKLYEFYGENFKDVITQINGVCNQKMFVKQCHNCSSEIVSSDIKDVFIRDFLKKYGVDTVYINKGCSHCSNGHIKGAVQPYVECLLFTQEIKRKLLECDKPYQMEHILYDILMKEKIALEFKLADAIRKGELNYDCLYDIL